MSVDMVELSETTPEPVKPAGIPQKNRVFLDFFWDLAKPDQEVRLKALENLIQYLKTNDQADELEYSLKRLVDGLAHTREAARPAFSLALGQVLGAFKHVSLQIVLDQIKAKHNLRTVKKKLIRNAAFGNLFGVLALHQSGRISEKPEVVLGCVQLLQSLSHHRQHLKDLPTQTMTDILNEIPEEVFEEVLLSALQTDLASAFSTPEQLQLLLVALRRFPRTLKPKKLKKLLGFSTIINADNIPKLTEVLKMAAQSSKKDCLLPRVVLDLLKLSLKEDSFQLFWDDAIINGMLLREPAGPTHYMSFRLLGSALPLLSEAQLKTVLSGEVMTYYAEHVASSQKGGRFKLAPEMEAHVLAFLQGCQDVDRQLAVMEAFSLLSSNGFLVMSPTWRVVQHLQPAAVQQYVEWLKTMFLQPQLDKLLDLGARKQKDKKDVKEQKENSLFSLRRWIVSRLCSIIDNNQVKKEEGIIMGVARFIFFHAFFGVKKASRDIEETLGKLSIPLDTRIRGPLVSSFFGLLLSLHHLPLDKDPAEGAAPNRRRVVGITADGTLWIYHMAQYAQLLLSQPKYAQCSKPFTPEQRQAWDSMLESVANLKKKEKKGPTPGSGAFQQLFLLVGLHLFTAPEELVDIMKDLQSCVDKALEKNAKKKKKKKPGQEEEPEWVDVMVEILLSLLSQQSRHIRVVCKTVFSSICPDVTKTALTAILDVLDPEKDDEDGALVVTVDNKAQKKNPDEEDDDDEMEGNKSDDDSDEAMEEDDDNDDDDEEEEEEDDDDDDGDDEGEMAEGNVDQHFRMELMKVLHGQNALATGEDGSSDEEMDDDAMMALDKGLATLFSEHKKNAEAKKDEKTKIQKEKTLVRDFKIKVLDLVEVFVTRQAGSPLVLCLVEPLLTIINRGMSSGSDQQEQDFLRRVADIFRNQLCRSKVYCRTAGDREGELHDLLDKLMTKTQKLSESSVCLYYFSASLYVVKVLRGAPPTEAKEEQTADGAAAQDLSFMGNVDVDRVAAIFKGALSNFMGKRKSPLSAQMFTDLFTKFPVLCVKLLDTIVQHITSGVRVYQQGQACMLMLRAMQSREVQQLLSGAPWTELCAKVSAQLTASLQQVGATENKEVKEKVLKALELCLFLVRSVQRQKLAVDLEPLQEVLQSLTSNIAFKKSGKLEDTYWAVVKHFGIQKPKVEKTKPDKEADLPQSPKKKKKGFLPETKKRKKRDNPILEPAAAAAAAEGGQATSGFRPGADKGQVKKKQDKKTKRKRPADGAAAAASQPNAAKKSKTTQSESKAAKKKNPKQKKEGGGKM